MPRIARVWTDLDLDSSGFSVGLRRARAEAKAASTAIQKELSGIRASITAGIGAVAGMGMLSLARDALDYASSLGEVASQLGVTTKDLQQYRYVATQVGVSQETMDKSLAKLTVTMGKARAGGKEQAATFRELNTLIGRDILASSQTAGDAIPMIAEALGKIEDPTKRARLEMALFGKAGQQLDPMLKDGSAAVNELRDAAQSLGIVLSDSQIQSADQTADKLSELNTVLSANIAGYVAQNTKEIYELVNALGQLIAYAPKAMRAIANFRDELVARQAAVRRDLGWISQNGEMARSGDRDVRQATTRIRVRNATARIDDAARRLESAGYIVPRNKDGSVNQAGIRRRTSADAVQASGTGVATPAAAAPKLRAGGRGSGESAAEKAERAREWAEDQISRAKINELSIQDQIVGSYTSRYALAVARIDADRADFARELKDREGLTAAQKRELTAANEAVLAKELELADQEKYQAQQREAFQLFAAQNDAQQEATRAQIDTARTAQERRAAELRLLELQKQAERAQLELVLATESTASAASDNARRRLAGLDDVYADRGAAVKRETMGPLARYMDDMPKTAAEIGEAYERIAVRGIESMNDALGESIKKTLGLKGAVGDLIAELVLLQAKRALFGGGDGEGVGGGLFSMIGRLVSSSRSSGIVSGDQTTTQVGTALGALFKNIPKLADGGSFMVGGRPGIDTNVLSINGSPRAMVSASERIDVSPRALRGPDDVPPVFVTIAADEGSAFVPRVTSIVGGKLQEANRKQDMVVRNTK